MSERWLTTATGSSLGKHGEISVPGPCSYWRVAIASNLVLGLLTKAECSGELFVMPVCCLGNSFDAG